MNDKNFSFNSPDKILDIRENYICCKCKYLIEKKHVSGFGDWQYICIKNKIGRNIDSESCYKFEKEMIKNKD